MDSISRGRVVLVSKVPYHATALTHAGTATGAADRRARACIGGGKHHHGRER